MALRYLLGNRLLKSFLNHVGLCSLAITTWSNAVVRLAGCFPFYFNEVLTLLFQQKKNAVVIKTLGVDGGFGYDL